MLQSLQKYVVLKSTPNNFHAAFLYTFPPVEQWNNEHAADGHLNSGSDMFQARSAVGAAERAPAADQTKMHDSRRAPIVIVGCQDLFFLRWRQVLRRTGEL